MPWLALAAAAALAVAVALWWYGRREEKVRGRGLAAALRGTALFLFLSAVWLPPLGVRPDPDPRLAILVDHSESMRYPIGAAGGATRIQAAREVVAELQRKTPAASVWSFAHAVARITSAELERLEATGEDSRVLGAIEWARASGADSIIVVTDGELTDREAGRRLAERFGVAVREIRVAEMTGRVGIRSVDVPRRVTAGDTLDLRVEIVATALAGDSASVRVDLGPDVSAVTTVELPATGRSSQVLVRIEADIASDSSEWIPLDVHVEGMVPPWDAAARFRQWIQVSPESAGAVLVSVDPDWESRYLFPVLERSVPGGGRAFLRFDDESWVRAGSRAIAGLPQAAVRRAAEAATLLVVQGDPTNLPAWLEDAARRRPAVMYLVRGPGAVPGTGVTVGEPMSGEWYAEMPPPPGPVSAHLIGVDAQDLPPLSRLYGSTAPADRAVLSSRRDRRGPVSPVAVLGSNSERRWAVVLGEGSWRWAARGDPGIALYRGLFAGMIRWLVERAVPQPVQRMDPVVRSGDSVRWRVAPGVRDLSVQVHDSSGAIVWSHVASDSASAIIGPPLGRGNARLVARGRTLGASFRIDQPFHVNGRTEELPNRVGDPLNVGLGGAVAERARPGSDSPVWPFAVAIVLLCAEWVWRRRMGLR
jgi:hypothetical protein